MLVKITRRRNNSKMSKPEFQISKILLDLFDIEYESDYSILSEGAPIWCSDKILALPEHYSYINSDLPKSMTLFRPLRNERHANILIDMFEDLEMNTPMDRLEINEFINDNGKKRYSGFIVVYGEVAKASAIKSAPSIPILKTSIVAKLMLNNISKDYYDEYKSLLKKYLYEQSEQKDDSYD